MEIILNDINTFSEDQILKVTKNLNVMYGPYSEERSKCLKQVHKHVKNQLSVS